MAKEPLRITKKQLERYQRYARVFGTDDGRWVLDDLEKDYGGACFVRGDHYETLYRSAFRDFVFMIKEMADRAEGPFKLEKETKEEE